MLRVLVIAALLSAASGAAVLVVAAASPQGSESILRINVVVVDAGQKSRPVPRHPLLISDNPPTSAPRRVVTDIDGTINVRLRPGNYTIESDEPFVLDGKAYEWREVVDIVAGRDRVLDLTAGNADVATAAPGAASSDASVEVATSSLLAQWQDSVVALWTPTTHASGFVIDAHGLVATNQRAIGASTSIEVQLADDVKVAANVVVSDPQKDVSILAINPSLTTSVRPVLLGCSETTKPVIAKDEELVTIGSPLRETKGPSFGVVSRVEPRSLASDMTIPAGSSGGPVFISTGSFVGLTSVAEEEDHRRRQSAQVVRLDDVCAVVAAAQEKIANSTPPSAAHLPVEPSRQFPGDALKEAARKRAGSLSPYAMASTDFDIAFITPVMLYGAQAQAEQTGGRSRGNAGPSTNPGQAMRSLMAFSNWADYVAEIYPVLLVRVTPRMVEGFWTKVARGAAQTQGVALPPMKRARSGFSRMRAYCGDTEVTPIHPFKLEQRVTETAIIIEGLYVFDPGALAPSCGSVKFVLYSEKEPQKADTRAVDAKVIEQVWQDFAPLRN